MRRGGDDDRGRRRCASRSGNAARGVVPWIERAWQAAQVASLCGDSDCAPPDSTCDAIRRSRAFGQRRERHDQLCRHRQDGEDGKQPAVTAWAACAMSGTSLHNRTDEPAQTATANHPTVASNATCFMAAETTSHWYLSGCVATCAGSVASACTRSKPLQTSRTARQSLLLHECSRPDGAGSSRRLHDRHHFVRDARRDDAPATGVRRRAARTGGRRSCSAGWPRCSASSGTSARCSCSRCAISSWRIRCRGSGRSRTRRWDFFRPSSCTRRSALVRGEERWILGVAYAGSAIAGGDARFCGAARGETPSSLGLLLLTITYGVLLGVLAVTERRPAGLSAKHHCGRTGRVRRLGASPESAHGDAGSGSVADRADWPSRVAAARASDSLSRLSLRLRRSVPEARAVVARARRRGVAAVRGVAAPLVDPHAIAARASDGGSHCHHRRAARAVDRDGARVSRSFSVASIDSSIASCFVARTTGSSARSWVGELARAREAETRSTSRVRCSRDALGAQVGNVEVERATDRHGRRIRRSRSMRASTEACITIPTAIEPSFEIRLAELSGGRALLSDDLMLIDAVAALVGRRIDEIRLERSARPREAARARDATAGDRS